MVLTGVQLRRVGPTVNAKPSPVTVAVAVRLLASFCVADWSHFRAAHSKRLPPGVPTHTSACSVQLHFASTLLSDSTHTYPSPALAPRQVSPLTPSRLLPRCFPLDSNLQAIVTAVNLCFTSSLSSSHVSLFCLRQSRSPLLLFSPFTTFSTPPPAALTVC